MKADSQCRGEERKETAGCEPAAPPPSSVLNWRYLEFSERPLSDSCWSVQTGPDGRVYIASCTEHTGGESATVVRYNDETDQLDYLFDVDEVTGDFRDSGRATQCKIHYSFVPACQTGLLYAATHLSGPPKGEKSYNPWASWHDARRAFRGACLIAYDTARDAVVSADLMIPREGCRCLAIDEERGVLYAVTYPRDHFVTYDLTRKKLTDHGRIGSVNSQCIFLDPRGRAFLFSDEGILLRFDPDSQCLEELTPVYPHASYQSAWHGVLYDAVEDPASGAVYMVPWKGHPRLARYWPMEGPEGRLEDLGPVTQDRDERSIMSVNLDHVGGLVFGPDGALHFTRSAWDDTKLERRRPEAVAELCRRDGVAGSIDVLARLSSEKGGNHYVSRAALSQRGNLIMGKILTSPAGVYRVALGAGGGVVDPQFYLRRWG